MVESVQRYNYSARNKEGALVSGSISSDSETSAARRLQAMGLAPLSIRKASLEGEGDILRKFKNRKKKVKAKDLAQFCRQFATMTEAGLPLVRALKTLAEQSDHVELKRVLPMLANDLESGISFSACLQKHPDVFPTLLVGMVASGEVSGSLSEAMNQSAESYEKDARLRSKVKGAMVYPIIVMTMAILMVIGMLIFVVPQFASIFKDMGAPLPVPTLILISMSQGAGIGVPILVVGILVFATWWKQHKNDRKVREFVDPLKLKIPVMGPFVKKVSIARFSRTFSALLSSGVPMIQTLDIVATTAGSTVISDALTEVRNAVRNGKPVHSTLEGHPIFPPLVNQMIATGEETGSLAPMLTKLAEYYEEEVETASEALSASLEPILLIFMGLIVGFMIIALYMPMFTVYGVMANG